MHGISMTSRSFTPMSSPLSLALAHQKGSFLLLLLHLGLLISVGLPQAAVQNLNACIMNLLPSVEASTLTQSAQCIGEGMMDIMKQHFIPAMLPPHSQGHEVVQDRPVATGIAGQEFVPRQRMGEVGDEHPSQGKSHPGSASHGQHKSPAFAEWTAQWPGAQEPHADPQRPHHRVVLHTPWKPLGPEFLADREKRDRVLPSESFTYI